MIPPAQIPSPIRLAMNVSPLDYALAPPHDGATVALRPMPRAHLVGIAGAGMRSLADVLSAGGCQISGSDVNAASLSGSRYTVSDEHRAEAVDRSVDLVVYSDAIGPTNLELVRAAQLGLPILSYPQALGRMMESRRGVAVAGTHGKSTTTAMVAEILTAGGFDPTVVYGASPLGKSSGGRLGRGPWMLAEACEYRDNFRFLKPRLACILNIELDHFDYFSTSDELEQAFARFAARVPADGLLLVRADCRLTARATRQIACPRESFGCGASATWSATDVRERRGQYSFVIRCRGRRVCDVKLGVPGRHNLDNALAAAALAAHCSADGAMIRAGLERFAGLERRLQTMGEHGGVAIVDDYAHHPTEVSASLATVRHIYPGRRICCVFQPHQVSRTRYLLDEFARSLHNADTLVLAEIFRAREEPALANETTAADLAGRVAALGTDVVQLATSDEIVNHLNRSLRAGDVLVTMGAGDIGSVAYEFNHRLRKIRQAG